MVTANDLPSAVRRATIYEPAVSILDLHLPPEAESPEVGLRVLEYLKTHLPESKVLVITSANGMDTATHVTPVAPMNFSTSLLIRKSCWQPCAGWHRVP